MESISKTKLKSLVKLQTSSDIIIEDNSDENDEEIVNARNVD